MAFCSKCGNQLEDGVKFCPKCGAAVGDAAGSAQANTGANFQKFVDTPDSTGDFDAQDIQQNKALAWLAYLGILFFIPLVAAPQSKYARFHANQGLILLIVGVAYGIIEGILSGILWAIAWGVFSGVVFTIMGILTTILGLVWIPFVVLVIMGIVNAATGKAKELPLIGKFKIIK